MLEHPTMQNSMIKMRINNNIRFMFLLLGISLNSNLTIRSKDVNIGDVIIGSQGYTDISSYKPSGMSHFLFATIVGFSYSLKYVAFGITSDARFMFGQASDTIKAVIVRYWYTNA